MTALFAAQLLQWPPSIEDLCALGGAFIFLGSAIAGHANQRRALARLFKKHNRMAGRVAVLWNQAIASGKVQPTQTGIDDDDDNSED